MLTTDTHAPVGFETNPSKRAAADPPLNRTNTGIEGQENYVYFHIFEYVIRSFFILHRCFNYKG